MQSTYNHCIIQEALLKTYYKVLKSQVQTHKDQECSFMCERCFFICIEIQISTSYYIHNIYMYTFAVKFNWYTAVRHLVISLSRPWIEVLVVVYCHFALHNTSTSFLLRLFWTSILFQKPDHASSNALSLRPFSPTQGCLHLSTQDLLTRWDSDLCKPSCRCYSTT